MGNGIRVRIRTSANQIRTHLHGFVKKVDGFRLVGQAFLHEGAKLDVDETRPSALQPQQTFQTSKTCAWIHLDEAAHALRTRTHSQFQDLRAARFDILCGKAAFRLRRQPNGFSKGPLAQRAAAKDHRLVEMDMRIRQSRQDQHPSSIETRRR
jgi:hypothetical protein